MGTRGRSENKGGCVCVWDQSNYSYCYIANAFEFSSPYVPVSPCLRRSMYPGGPVHWVRVVRVVRVQISTATLDGQDGSMDRRAAFGTDA